MSDLSNQQHFAKSLLAECEPTSKGHEKWLAIMRFGMGTLKQSPPFLLCLVVERAYQCFAFQKDEPRLSLGEFTAKIAYELDLELIPGRDVSKDGDA